MNKINIIASLLGFASGRPAKEFYVGITDDPETRLFEQHKVDKAARNYVCYKADSEEDARDIEKIFLALGLSGGPGGGDGDTKYVYCYQITDTTQQ